MALTERVRAALHAMTAPPPQQKTLGSTSIFDWFGRGADFFTKPQALTMPYAQHPTVHAAVSAISQSVSALPLEMFPEDDTEREEPITDSIVLSLMENPSPDMDGPMLIEGTIDFMKLNGDAFWFLDGEARRDPKGPKFPTRIDLWDPCNVRAIMDKVTGTRVVGWELQIAQEVFRTDARNVIQFKHWNPYNPVRGLPPLSAALTVASGGYKALQYQEAFFENNAIPSGILTPKGDGQIIQPEAMLRLRDEWESRHMGAGKHGRVGALNAQIEFIEMGTSSKDMDFPVWLDAASAFILMVFKVPPSVAGLQKDANYNAAVQQAKQFWFNHLPLVHYLERRIYQRLCKQYGIKEKPYFKTEGIKAMTEDQEAVSNIARNMWNMAVPFEQINDRLELGYDTSFPAAKIPWTTFSQVNANEQATAPAKSDVGGPSRGPVPGDTPAQPGDESTVADDPTQGKAMSGREFQRTLSWKTLMGKVRDEEATYRTRLRDHFYLLRTDVLAKLRARKAIKADLNVESLMFDDKKAADDLKGRVEPLYKSALQKGAEAVAAELQINSSFDFLSPAAQKFLREKLFEISGLVDDPVAEELRAALLEGMDKGESVDKLAERVAEVFDVQRFRAERIARTEIAESFNGGRFVTMKDAGVERIEWLSARDNRVRDSHAEVDGEVVVLGDKFSNGLLYPLDPSGPPEEIVNCRCVSVPVA
jgi:HK97 family phage portal protein